MSKVSEKTLELNLGAELLLLARTSWANPRALLLGTTQQQEKHSGVDSVLDLPASAKLLVLQYKAPLRPRRKSAPVPPNEQAPYDYKLDRDQHTRLLALSQISPDSVYYVFPFFLWVPKLRTASPRLLSDTWFCGVHGMSVNAVFSGYQTRTVHCSPGTLTVNPEYELEQFGDRERRSRPEGIEPEAFVRWWEETRTADHPDHRRDRWNSRSGRLRLLAFL